MRLFSYLIEHVVTNVPGVDAYVASWVRRIHLPQGQQWMKKRLRTIILNNSEFLTRIAPEDVTADMPEYVQRAAQQGEPVFFFDANAQSALNTSVEHMCDLFTSLHEVIQTPPERNEDGTYANPVQVEHFREAEKIVSKLNKMTWEQVEQAHEAWMNRAGNIVANMSKDGGEVVLTFQNGYYWIRYTNGETMQRDGHDLQNCLRTGNYWKAVQSGEQAVYGLRKSNEEAVVGVRIMLDTPPRIVECKGKNNDPPIPEYVPYILAFLEHVGVSNMTADLKKAGIYVNDGQYGTFEDVATAIYDQNGIRIMQAKEDDATRTLVRVRRQQFWVTSKDGKGIEALSGDDSISNKNIIAGLNALSPDGISQMMQDRLAQRGVFPSANGFGDLDDVGEVLWTDPENPAKRAVTTLKNGSGYLFFFHSEQKPVRYTVKDNVIESLPSGLVTAHILELLPALDAGKLRYGPNIDRRELWPLGWVATVEGYRQFDEVSKVVHRMPGGHELRQNTVRLAGSNGKMFMTKEGDHTNVFVLTQKTLHFHHGTAGRMTKNTVGFAQWLATQYEIHDVEGFPDVLGMIYDFKDWTYKSTLADFVRIMSVPKVMAKYDYLSEVGSSGHFAHLLGKAFFPDGRDQNGHLKPEYQKALYNLLKPTKAELVHIISDDEMILHGTEFRSITFTVPDMILSVAGHIFQYQDKIETIKAAIETAVDHMIRKNGNRAQYIFKNSNSYHSYDFNVLHRKVREANERTHQEIIRVGEETSQQGRDDEEVATDHFTALNALRRGGVKY